MRMFNIMAISTGIMLLIMLPAFASGTPFSLSGTVIDVHGNPVKGANVTLLAIGWMDTTPSVVESVLTNDTGGYLFTNALPDRTLVKAIVSYDDGNKTYGIPVTSTPWMFARGDYVIPSNETQFRDYPPATEGYIIGNLLTNATPFGVYSNGEVHLVSDDGKNRYEENVNVSNHSFFMFHVPAGKYNIYATYDEKDLRYTSGARSIEVVPSWSPDFVNSTYGITKDGILTAVINSVPFTVIYLEPASRQLIQPCPTAEANTSAIINGPVPPELPVKTVVEVTAGGAFIASSAYILFKFFGIGTVARARARLDKNKNRSALFGFIAANPGVTLHDIAHATDTNLGTVRYHLFILGLNHRIVSSKFDDKFVRYFTNSGSYTKSDQLVISMVRRDGVRNVISLLLSEPGLTNAEISNKLGIRVSATSRYIKELIEKGLVSKEPRDNGTLLYSIDSGLKENIVRMLERVNSV